MNLRQIELIVRPDVRNILDTIKKTTSYALLAGGYLRDAYYRKPQKDLDVFVNSDVNIPKLTEMLTNMGWAHDEPQKKQTGSVWAKPKAKSTDAAYQSHGHIHNIVGFTKTGQLPIQIIISDLYVSTTSVLNTFDFGICQIALMNFGMMQAMIPSLYYQKKQKTPNIMKEF